MKKILMCLIIAVTVMAAACGFSFASEMKAGQLVYDDGDLLTADEEAEIQASAEKVGKKVKADVLVVFTSDPSSSDARSSAEEIANSWASSGNATQKNQATIVYYVDMANRNLFVDEYNAAGKQKLKDSDIDAVTSAAQAAMAEGNAASALAALKMIKKKGSGFNALWSILFGAIGGGLSTLIGVSKHSTVAKVTRRHYLKDGKASVLRSNEVFRNTTTKVVDRSSSSGSSQEKSSAGSDGHHGGGASF